MVLRSCLLEATFAMVPSLYVLSFLLLLCCVMICVVSARRSFWFTKSVDDTSMAYYFLGRVPLTNVDLG